MDEEGSFPLGIGFITSAGLVFDHIISDVLCLFFNDFYIKSNSQLILKYIQHWAASQLRGCRQHFYMSSSNWTDAIGGGGAQVAAPDTWPCVQTGEDDGSSVGVAMEAENKGWQTGIILLHFYKENGFVPFTLNVFNSVCLLSGSRDLSESSAFLLMTGGWGGGVAPKSSNNNPEFHSVAHSFLML